MHQNNRLSDGRKRKCGIFVYIMQKHIKYIISNQAKNGNFKTPDDVFISLEHQTKLIY